MATGVGLRIAEDECTAAIVTDAGELQYVVRESVLHMAEDGDTVLGGPPPAGNSHSISGFIASVGDPNGLPVDDGEAYRAEDLVATALFCLINLTAEHLSGPAEFYATHPAHWLTQDVQALREALDYLGLRSVVLVSEADLPAVDTAEPNKAFAYDAARAALAAVLATPAGATPPDPTNAENSTVVTDIIPTVPAAASAAQAYSAALPAASPLPVVTPTPTEVLTGEPAETPAPAARRNRIPLLIAAAVLLGLVLGGIGVAVLFRGTDTTEVPTVRDAKSDQATVTPTTAPPPEPIAPPTTEPPVTITTTEEPEPTTTPPPPTTTAEPTTTEPPTSTRRTTTTRPGFGSPPAWEPPENDWTPPTIVIPVPN
ncbi:hypothetical protein [Nocardia sp. XZ_19_385]|uniref:hypothetical protein n=1 Tax=Nocardia sp. XZ_19_385 TaxID=2769488 RepID=UPI00188FADD4|nr:hypothetical protein [Nocardia sp. XZ_19_385]